ncbi:MAG: GMC family oxidoreductase N-terminal domain-containing protein [Gammaproteobacteria bacterium]
MAHSTPFDYIIVGGGTAGCVLANRLSADPAIRVALIEAGPPDRSAKIRIPAAVAAAIADPAFGWGYHSTSQAHLNGRRIPIPRGRVLGGCSSINGMAYFRGHPLDFDDWAASGAVGWSYQDVLPHFLRSENNEAWPASRFHGRGGEMNVIDIPQPNALIHRFLDAAVSLGFKQCLDFNGEDPEGFGPRQATIRNGQRESGVTAFLRPALTRPNLTVFTDTLVRRIRIEARRARGVTIERAGVVQNLEAQAEVILSGGAYGSPQLLLLSGVGPADDLRALGIEVVHVLPGVGMGLHDHPATAIQMRTTNADSYGLSWKTFPRGFWNVLEYAFARRGPLASNVFEATGFVRSRPGLDRPDLQIVFMPAHRNANGFAIPIGHGYGIVVIAVQPKSRGRVTLASADPRVAPNIDPNFLANPLDTQTLLEGARLARRILAAPAFRSLRSVELSPGPTVRDDATWVEYIRNSVVTVHHPCSTCRMGADDLAVVDPQLRVRGLTGLRVVDASVFPQVVGGNSNAAVVMVAERASDLILSARAASTQAA